MIGLTPAERERRAIRRSGADRIRIALRRRAERSAADRRRIRLLKSELARALAEPDTARRARVVGFDSTCPCCGWAEVRPSSVTITH